MEQCIVPVKVFCCYSTVEDITTLYEGMQVVYGVQVIKTRLLPIYIFNLTVRQCFKDRIAAQAIGQGKRSGLDMFLKYGLEFFTGRFCPVFCVNDHFTLPLDTSTDTDILIGYATFLGFCPMAAAWPAGCFGDKPPFIAVKHEGLVKFSDIPQNHGEFTKKNPQVP